MLDKLPVHVIITAYLSSVFRKCSFWRILAGLSNSFSASVVAQQHQTRTESCDAHSPGSPPPPPAISDLLLSLCIKYSIVRLCLLFPSQMPGSTSAKHSTLVLKDSFLQRFGVRQAGKPPGCQQPGTSKSSSGNCGGADISAFLSQPTSGLAA